MKKSILKNIPTIIFLLLLLIGMLIFKDYGIPWDEPHQQKIGEVNYEYIVRKNPELLTFYDKYYGPSFEIFLIFSQKTAKKVLNITEEYQTYQLRHLLNWLLFFISTIFFYLINKNIFNNKLIALLSTSFLILSPRIFAHAFFNSKDIPLFSFFIISFYFLIKFQEKKTWSNLIFFSLSTALTITIRLLGLFIPLIFIISQILKTNRKNIKYIIYYLLISILFIYSFWPILWHNPIQNIFDAIQKMFHYPWNADVLFMGKIYQATKLPFYYMPVWFLIATPPIYLFLFIFSFFSKKKTPHFYLCLSFFFLPILLIILNKSTLYDSWRHLFFIYPFFIILVTFGFKNILEKKQKLAYFLVVLNIILISKFMIANHPHQHLYFNFLAGKNIRKNYELDYWGLSFKKGLEFLLNYEKSKKLKITTSNLSGSLNAMILKPEDKNRFEFYSPENIDESDYFITNFRWHPNDYSYQNKVYSEKIGNTEILAIYRL
jgi:dolichyl-phosphate-mannose-protein mannosyltransferase